MSIYNYWGTYENKICLRNSFISDTFLINSKTLSLKYQIKDKILEISGHFQVESKTKKILKFLIDPEKRKLWDCRLNDFYPSENYHKMIYSTEKTLYEYLFSIKIENFSFQTIVTMNGLLSNCRQSEFQSIYTITKIQGNDSFGSSSYSKKLCEWKIELKGKSSKIFIHDIIGEDSMLQQSFIALQHYCGNTHESFAYRPKNNSLRDSIERKVSNSFYNF